MSSSRYVRTASALLAMLFAACAATTLEATWTRPGFADSRIEGPVMIVAVARDATVRRVYEDDMAAKLAARGVTALRSYETVPGVLDKDATDRLIAAAHKAGARYLLSTALISQEVEQVVTQDPVGGYRGWYGAYWGSASTEVHSYNVYIAQTSLTDVGADRVEWTARTRTSAPSNIEKETRAFVDVILGALSDAGLLGAAK